MFGQLSRLAPVGRARGQVALAFAALPAAVTRVVVGVKSEREVAASAAAALRLPLPRALWREAEAAGLLPKGLLAAL
jgi:aryl-alcohol dehydrogenase-like predicted oxidoreductase